MQHKENEKKKQPYEKPRLRTIELVAEEVLGIACKTRFSDPTGIGSSGCTNGSCSVTPGS